MSDRQFEQIVAAEPALQKLLVGLERRRRDNLAEQAQADPARHKLTRVFPTGVSAGYRYYDGGRDGRNREVRFCWSVNRNAAGYYLGWREVISKTQAKRDRWTARRVRRKLAELAWRRADLEKSGE